MTPRHTFSLARSALLSAWRPGAGLVQVPLLSIAQPACPAGDSCVQGEGLCGFDPRSSSRGMDNEGLMAIHSAPACDQDGSALRHRWLLSMSCGDQVRHYHPGSHEKQWQEDLGSEEPPQFKQSQPRSAASALRLELLELALTEVKEHGWSNKALEIAAGKLGLSPAAAGILGRREGELVEHFIARCNQRLMEEMQAMRKDGRLENLGSTRARLAAALKIRLQMLEPYIDTWPQALSIAIQPRNAPSSLKLLGQLVDDVWAIAGEDKSTDYNYYTKRGLLAGVYTSTELFMLTDYTPGFADTWQALSRRLDDVVIIGKQAGSLKSAFSQLNEAVKGMQKQRRRQQPPSDVNPPGSPAQAAEGQGPQHG